MVECYRTFVGAMLDLTDNLVDGAVVHPPDTVVHDGDDPYLVVAADKGTATFSDIANSVSLEHGFWLGDAFASGGSAGYDHKAMGITARGAWESVRRHASVARPGRRHRSADGRSASATCPVTCSATGCCGRRRCGWSPPSTTATSSSIPTPTRRSAFAERARLFDAATVVVGRLRRRVDLVRRRRLPADAEGDRAQRRRPGLRSASRPRAR